MDNTPTKTAMMWLRSIIHGRLEQLKEQRQDDIISNEECVHKSNALNSLDISLGKLLEKEKSQIVDAHMAGDFKMDAKEAETYFSQTYKQ